MKSGSCSATTVAGSAVLPFVISTGAQRSGEICGVSGPSLGGRSQGDETGPVQQRLLLEAPPSPLSSRPELRRSAVERSAVSAALSWKCVSIDLRAAASVHCSTMRLNHPLPLADGDDLICLHLGKAFDLLSSWPFHLDQVHSFNLAQSKMQAQVTL
jgi:hypothetical protein